MTIEEDKILYRSKCIHQINWKRFDLEQPEQDQEVWVLQWHNKGHFPSSFEIAAGECEYGNNGSWRVNTCDYNGGGSECFYPNDYDNGFIYWCDKWEISVPEEMISWDWDSGVR